MADAKPKRKFRPGLIEPDPGQLCDLLGAILTRTRHSHSSLFPPVENALLVHYEVEEIVDGQVSLCRAASGNEEVEELEEEECVFEEEEEGVL